MIKIDELKNPYSLLDEILIRLKDTTENAPKLPIEIYTVTQSENIGDRDRSIILEKLVRDKYVSTKEMPPQ